MAILALSGCSDALPPSAVPAPPSIPSATALPGDPAPGDVGSATPTPRAERVAIPGEFLVKFRNDAPKASIDRALSKLGSPASRPFKTMPGLRLVKSGGASPATSLPPIDDPAIEYIEPNYLYRANRSPNDPRYPEQWGLNNTGQLGFTPDSDIDAPEAWDLVTGDPTAVIAVIDTGIDYLHEDLAANVFRNVPECTRNGIDDDGNGYVDDCHGIDTANDDSDPMDDAGHGTHVAGIAGAVGDNGIGIAGVAWRARLLACKFLDERDEGSTADAVECLDYLAEMKDRGANIVVVNASWGGPSPSRALDEALRGMLDRGVIVVASSGNDINYDGNVDLEPQFPCNSDVANVVCVAAAHGANGLALWTNFGPATVHLGAPGEHILSTVPGNGYAFEDGSSMAAPHVAGAVVLLRAQSPARDWRATRNLLLTGTDRPTSLPMPIITKGRLNLLGSMSCTSSRLLARTRPLLREPLIRATGARIPFRALNLRCDAGDGNVTLNVSPGQPPLTLRDDGTLGDRIAGDGEYGADWIAPAPGSFALEFPAQIGASAQVRVDPYLEPGFPRQARAYALGSLTFGYQALVGNMDADPQLEMLTSTPELHAWNHDGTPLPGWPVPIDFARLNPTFAELDGDPARTEVAIASGKGLWLLDGPGNLRTGSPLFIRSAWQAPPVADVDGDGRDEIIAFPARRADGTLLDPAGTIPINSGRPTSASVADLDYDGDLDFVVAHAHRIHASDLNGQLAGFPLEDAAAWWPSNESGRTSVVGDVDADGQPEIVSATVMERMPFGRIRVVSPSGRLERVINAPEAVHEISLADLNGDGIPEILGTGHETIHAWSGDGGMVPGWPVRLPEGQWLPGHAPVVGDLDGDGFPDIVMLAYSSVLPDTQFTQHVYRRDGTEIASWNREYPGIHLQTPAIADIDLDGRNELVLARAHGPGVSDHLFVFDAQAPGPYGPVEWGQYQEGPGHRGEYVSGKNLVDEAIVAVQRHGRGTIRSGDGRLACGNDCLERVARGTTLTLTATAEPGARFERWLGACANQGNPCTITANAHVRVAADFASTLEVSLAGNGSGTIRSSPAGIACPGECSKSFGPRTSVVLTASPAPGSVFDGWSGGCAGTLPNCTLAVESAVAVTASFAKDRQLEVLKGGGGTGVVKSSPAGIDCGPSCTAAFAPGSNVRLEATPDAASTFAGWGGACPAGSTACTLTMSTARTITVSFAKRPALTVEVTGSGTGTVTVSGGSPACAGRCSTFHDTSAVVTLTAVPAAGHTLASWSGDCAGTAWTCTLTMSGDRSVTARFDGPPPPSGAGPSAGGTGGSGTGSGGTGGGGTGGGGTGGGGGSDSGGGGGGLDWQLIVALAAWLLLRSLVPRPAARRRCGVPATPRP